MTDDVSFSIREGIVSENPIQLDAMSWELRNSLWNVMYSQLFHESVVDSVNTYDQIKKDSPFGRISFQVWGDFFRVPIDEIRISRRLFLRDQFKPNFLGCLWHRAYDCIEFVARKYEFRNDEEYKKFENACNTVLEREKSGYRLVNKAIIKITNKNELESIRDASTTLEVVNQHITTAISHLSNRTNPDYRNSIKESISAVESLCKKIVGNEDTTLGVALNEIVHRGNIELHEDMKEAFRKFYGYTSDSGGIRHALIEGDLEPDFDDAKLMLVSCSAFVNYLISKAAKAGINID